MLRLGGPGQEAASWTRRPPAIQVATRSRTLVFLAQGPPPYRLQWAGPTALPADLPMDRLVPAASGAAPLPSPALLSDPTEMRRVAAAQPIAKPSPIAAPASTETLGGMPKVWWLWAALLVGIVLMACMARSLLSSSRQAARTDERGP
ncbi:MAG: DUF3999 family protein [Rubrivivax sp.]|nr:MAG: DUF3999 family protein [Rubrivivax sp.]